MTDSILPDPMYPDLHGLRVGLSGAIPETAEWEGRALDWEILNAVSTLADTVFSGGGHLVHGAHPTFAPRILSLAEPYARERGAPVVTFVLSGLFRQEHLAQQLSDARYRDVLELVIVDPVYPPGHEGGDASDPEVRNASLTAMRERLIEGLDALVVIGGKRWRGSPNKPGILEEVELARARGIPCYPLGGLGGMAAELVDDPRFQELLSGVGGDRVATLAAPGRPAAPQGEAGTDELLANGLSARDNRFIQTSRDYGRAISVLGSGLEMIRGQQR